MFASLLIANRGEIAVRVMRTAKRLGLRTIAVYSDADAQAMHVAMADDAVRIGPAAARDSYLRGDLIISAARETGAEAIHPGYGFLSENADFADAVIAAGLIFVGPPGQAIRAMGLKDAAKALMDKAGVPTVPGYHGADQSPEHLAHEAQRAGFPVMIKAVAGGGGKGMRKVDAPAAFAKALEGAQREAQAAFGDPRVLIERFVNRPRHIEIQVFADAHGNAVYLHERDCSIQRRHQKVIEEAPAPGMAEGMRRAMGAAAVKCALAIGYRGAGTVEFIVDSAQGLRDDGFFFMEMNTRLQVEHPVTEMITGLDLVEWQLRVAAGEPLPLSQEHIPLKGHAIEVRLYAEDPAKGFLPSTGKLARLSLPQTQGALRTDTGVREGDHVTMYYDPMIAKVIAHGADRSDAARHLASALSASEIAGVRTNLGFLIDIVQHAAFGAMDLDTAFIERHRDDLLKPFVLAPFEAWVLAVAALLEERRGQGAAPAWPGDPWNALDGFRLGPRQRETLSLRSGDETLPVAIAHDPAEPAVTIGGRTARLRYRADAHGRISAMVDGRKAEGSVWRAGPYERHVLLHGRVHVFFWPDPFAIEAEADAGGLAVLAPMPGRIIQVLVKAGDLVVRGQALAVLEAMKMEHTLLAPAALEIEAVTSAVGDQVGEGAAIIRFKAAAIS